MATHSINHIHILCQYNLIQELETSEFSHLLIGQHRIGHLITHTPLTLRPSFVFASVQEISAFAMGAEINLTKRQTLHMISVCSMKSGAHTHHPQQIYLIQDLEMLIIMQPSMHPSFHPQSLLISDEVKNQLQADHKSLLSSLFGIYLEYYYS